MQAGILTGTLYDIENVTVVHHVNQALKAHTLFTRDKDYIVKNNEVVIIDEFTGRMMPGRRYSEGLHQALEAKEHVDIQPENQTLASVTFQNYFRLYDKLAGMTGTAATEASEFMDIYGLDVLEIPTNMPIGSARRGRRDLPHRRREVAGDHPRDRGSAKERGQPCLVGTASIEKSEHLSELLKQRKIEHQVLNARYHEQEAKIIAQAGVPGHRDDRDQHGRPRHRHSARRQCRHADFAEEAGSPGDAEYDAGMSRPFRPRSARSAARRFWAPVRTSNWSRPRAASRPRWSEKPGGLYVIGTERHESRRIDNQLRGRSGRQGDPGRSKFYLSLQDDLMRIFGSDKMDSVLKTLGLKEARPSSTPG